MIGTDTVSEFDEAPRKQRTHIATYLGILHRRRVEFLVPILFTWLLVWGSTWLVRPEFKSSTLILVEQPTMPKNFVEPNISDDLQDRLQSITQQILSRTRLLFIVDKWHLYADGRRPLTGEELVRRMRKDIQIDLVRDTRNNEISAFRISYSAHTPQIARMVTDDLSSLFINENLKVRQEQSEGTTRFIESQLEEARNHLVQQEEKVRAFEVGHQGMLPSQQTSNLQILSGLQSQLQNEQDTLNTARQQRVYLQSLLEQSRSAHRQTHSADGLPSDLAQVDQELARLQRQLLDLSSRYTSQHPDIQNLKVQIAKAQVLRKQLASSAKLNGVAEAEENPEEVAPAVSQLRGQLHANDLEIANRESTVAGLKSRIDEYQHRLNAEPATEQALAELTRGYDQSKVTYDDLLKKKNDSAMATSMEHMQQGERFTILDPPSLPVKPDFPDRLKFCGFGVGLGLALGVAVVGAFEMLDDRLHEDDAIKAMLPETIIYEIPVIARGPADAVRKRDHIAAWALPAATFVTIAVGAAISIFQN
jgi:polysaccharide biosynthesis transport protein